MARPDCCYVMGCQQDAGQLARRRDDDEAEIPGELLLPLAQTGDRLPPRRVYRERCWILGGLDAIGAWLLARRS